jgi:hypothetical protein
MMCTGSLPRLPRPRALVKAASARSSWRHVAAVCLLVLASLALSAADVAWACQTPDQIHLSSQANMLVDAASDARAGLTQHGHATPCCTIEAVRALCVRGRAAALAEILRDRSKLLASRANLARAPPHA